MNSEKGGLVDMFVLRKLFKIMLLPVVFVLFFIKCLLATSLKLTESIVGLFIMIVGGGIVYYLIWLCDRSILAMFLSCFTGWTCKCGCAH